MGYEDQAIQDAAIGRIGADRMAAHLPCIPDGIRGDLEVVLKLREEVESLKCELFSVSHLAKDSAIINKNALDKLINTLNVISIITRMKLDGFVPYYLRKLVQCGIYKA
jgi:hypothetical protein